MCPFHYFHIDHNAPCFVPPSPTPRILHNHCFQFHLGITVVLKEIHDNDYTKFWEVNRVHDLCENGESGGVDQHLGRLSLEISVPLWFVYMCGSSVGCYIGQVALYCQLSIGWVSVDRLRLWWLRWLGWLGWLGWLRRLGGLEWLRWLGWLGWLG